jgi:hypothetical protein
MASTYDEYTDLLSQGAPKGDSAAETLGDIDLGGNYLFGYGDDSRNDAIAERQAKIKGLQGKITAEQARRLEAAIASNSADWAKLTTDILGEDGQKLHDFYQDVEGSDQRNLDTLKGEFGKYNNLEDLFKDPNFYGDVGDVTNQARPTNATVGEQRAALAKMKTLSDPTESAQERFQRYMAQRDAEAGMKSARDTIAQDLKARGVYGSGAEVVQNMMAQADAGNRQYMANLAADAQAQGRATQMLGLGADLASKMRGQETDEGKFATQTDMFNNQIGQQTANARSAALQSGREGDNRERNKMATTTYTGATGLNQNRRSDNANEIGTRTGLARGKMDLTSGGANALNVFGDRMIEKGDTELGVLESQKEHDALLGGGMG